MRAWPSLPREFRALRSESGQSDPIGKDNALATGYAATLIWLTDPSRVIAYRDEQRRIHLTVLGKAGVHAMLPLPYVAGVGQMVRDLISLDAHSKLLTRWSALDHLFLAFLRAGPALIGALVNRLTTRLK